MIDLKDIRWHQRFENFDNAFRLLQEAFHNPGTLSLLEKEGAIQRFEYTYELAWKTLKDYLEHTGVVLEEITPREVIKEAFAARIIDDGQIWIDMLLLRNLLSHKYDQKTFEAAIKSISESYLPAISQTYAFLKQKRQSS